MRSREDSSMARTTSSPAKLGCVSTTTTKAVSPRMSTLRRWSGTDVLTLHATNTGGKITQSIGGLLGGDGGMIDECGR
ncbi:hypothetical protein BDZ89DRAFT_1070876 [Hymenopellis radicata]|nr:hypothetical protein BDZ89DRAFT_1070876 [Hymenopellis radicata]